MLPVQHRHGRSDSAVAVAHVEPECNQVTKKMRDIDAARQAACSQPDGAAAGLVLAIETSCDETAAAVVRFRTQRQAITRHARHEHDARPSGKILSNIVLSQLHEHEPYGGVVPEIAARAHVEILDVLVKTALAEAGVTLADIDAIAATSGPGLIGGLMVGTMTAKAMALAASKPFFAINHLEGHALSPRLIERLDFPYLLLLVSGGHTQLVLVRGVGDYERWGTTIDDALGEAFDKTAKLLDLPYPGGPSVERAALCGDPSRFAFPRPLKGDARHDFSFSGLKTAVRQAATAIQPLSRQDVADICASFQAAITSCLQERLSRPLVRFRALVAAIQASQSLEPHLVIAGGVAANRAIRAALDDSCRTHGISLVAPPPALCTDNAAMIAWAAAERISLGKIGDDLAVAPRARWPLDEKAQAVLGSGKRGAKV